MASDVLSLMVVSCQRLTGRHLECPARSIRHAPCPSEAFYRRERASPWRGEQGEHRMSEQPGDELPLTADAFQRPAASRRNVTSRVIRIHPPDADAQASPTEGVAPTDPLEPQFAQPSGQSAPPSPVHATADPRAAWQPSVPDPSVPDCAPAGYPAPGGQPQPWHYAAPPPGQATYPPPSTSFAPSQHPSLPAQPGVPPDAHLTDYGYEQFTAAARQAAAEPPAEWGWRGRVRRLTGGLVAPGMSREEAAYKGAVRQVQVTLPGPKTIVFR